MNTEGFEDKRSKHSDNNTLSPDIDSLVELCSTMFTKEGTMIF